MIDVVRFISFKRTVNFLKFRKLGYVFSVSLILASIMILIFNGLNLGIDFSGGILLDVKSNEVFNLDKIRKDLSKFSPELQSVGDGTQISIRLQVSDEAKQQETVDEIKTILGGDKVEYRNVQLVGPKVGGEIIRKGIYAIFFSLLAIALYIWIRYDFGFGIGAILSLLHDVILTFGFLSLFRIEFSLTTVAAILTIVGYSINDTVVSYDRVRENLKKLKGRSLFDIINISTTETFTRTTLTSFTTFIAVFALFMFAGPVLRSFSATMLFGILIGTYSSIFVAMPALLFFNVNHSNSAK